MKNSLHLSLPLREYLKQNLLQNLFAYVVTQQQLEAQVQRDNKQIRVLRNVQDIPKRFLTVTTLNTNLASFFGTSAIIYTDVTVLYPRTLESSINSSSTIP